MSGFNHIDLKLSTFVLEEEDVTDQIPNNIDSNDKPIYTKMTFPDGTNMLVIMNKLYVTEQRTTLYTAIVGDPSNPRTAALSRSIDGKWTISFIGG